MREPDMQHVVDATDRVIEVRRDGELIDRIPIAVPKHTRRAWRSTGVPVERAETASLTQWLVHCPHVHTMWSYWWITLMHLRDIPGVPPAHKRFEQAEYELAIYAQDPELEPDPDNGRATMRLLHPVDVNEQFHGPTDEQAIALVESWVKAIVHGLIAPDTDYRAAWRETIARGVEHVTTGHPTADA